MSTLEILIWTSGIFAVTAASVYGLHDLIQRVDRWLDARSLRRAREQQKEG